MKGLDGVIHDLFAAARGLALSKLVYWSVFGPDASLDHARRACHVVWPHCRSGSRAIDVAVSQGSLSDDVLLRGVVVKNHPARDRGRPSMAR